jgi:hypothetical protein
MKTKPKLPSIGLTASDWEEIYYALDTKLSRLKNGDYEKCLEHAKCTCSEEWIAHINNIMDAIGPDGDDAFQRGVVSLETLSSLDRKRRT